MGFAIALGDLGSPAVLKLLRDKPGEEVGPSGLATTVVAEHLRDNWVVAKRLGEHPTEELCLVQTRGSNRDIGVRLGVHGALPRCGNYEADHSECDRYHSRSASGALASVLVSARCRSQFACLNDASKIGPHVLRMPSRRLMIGGTTLLIVVVVLQFTVRFSVDDIENAVDRAGVFGPIAYAFVLFLGLSVPFNPVSDIATVNVAALFFDPAISVAGTFVAHTTALSVNFFVAKRYGHVGLRLLTGRGEIAIVDRLSARMSYRTVFVTRFMLPLTGIGIDIVSYLAGMRGLRFVPFYVASILPWTLISVAYFYSTAYLKDRSLFLFFLPAVLLLLVPPILLYSWRWIRGGSRDATVQEPLSESVSEAATKSGDG